MTSNTTTADLRRTRDDALALARDMPVFDRVPELTACDRAEQIAADAMEVRRRLLALADEAWALFIEASQLLEEQRTGLDKPPRPTLVS